MPIPATVYLVGAGPGDPGLITVAGAEALRGAAVVVYDYLANPELLKLAPSTAELIYVGKSGIQHTKTQDQINTILVEKARQYSAQSSGRSPQHGVVRLKGGDPYVFGRGGEEAEYLRENGIPFAVIPGITSGIAAPAYAGIPVTHRDFSSTITLITGHERDTRGGESADEEEGRVNYEALVKLEGTLVFYMGIKSLPLISQRLIAAGLDPETPAAVIRWGTRAEQQTVTGTVSTIADVVQKAGLKAPAITIIGRVVSLHQTLNWFEKRPLFGKTIIVTRTRQQASELSSKLAALGAKILEIPTIELRAPSESEWPAIDRALQQIPAYDWVIFTSPNGVTATWDRLCHLGLDARHFPAPPSHRVAAVGEATADALRQIGIHPDLIPEKFTGEHLAAALQSHIPEAKPGSPAPRFLILRADIARPVLREELQKFGQVDDVAIYQTIRPPALPAETLGAIADLAAAERVNCTWITFTSASTANNLWELLPPEYRQFVSRLRRASIGPITSEAMRKLGTGEWSPDVEAGTHTIRGLIQALMDESLKP